MEVVLLEVTMLNQQLSDLRMITGPEFSVIFDSWPSGEDLVKCGQLEELLIAAANRYEVTTLLEAANKVVEGLKWGGCGNEYFQIYKEKEVHFWHVSCTWEHVQETAKSSV